MSTDGATPTPQYTTDDQLRQNMAEQQYNQNMAVQPSLKPDAMTDDQLHQYVISNGLLGNDVSKWPDAALQYARNKVQFQQANAGSSTPGAIQAAGQAIEQGQRNDLEDQDDRQTQRLLNESPDITSPDSWLNQWGSKAGAFNAGFENIPNKVNYDINSSVNWLAKELGTVSPQEYSAKQKEYDQMLQSSLGQGGSSNLDPSLSYQTDVQNHPTLAQATQNIGALGTEIAGVGGAAKAVGSAAKTIAPSIANYLEGSMAGRVGAGVLSDISQGAALGNLQADPNQKGEGTTFGAMIGGGLGLPLRTGGELAKSYILGNNTVDQLMQNMQNADQMEKTTGVQASAGQAFGNAAIQGTEKAARNASFLSTNPFFANQYQGVNQYLNKNLSQYGDVTSPGAWYGNARQLMNDYGDVLNNATQVKNAKYSDALLDMDQYAKNSGGVRADTAGQHVSNYMNNPPPWSAGLLDSDKKAIQTAIDQTNRVSNGANSATDLQGAYENIGNIIGDGLTSNKAYKWMTGLKGAMNDDLTRISENANPEAMQNGISPWGQANQYTKDVHSGLANIKFTPNDVFKQAGQMTHYIGSLDDPVAAQNIMDNLGPNVQNDMKAYIAAKTFDSSPNNKAFMQNFPDAVKQYGFIFNDQDKQFAQGMTNINDVIGDTTKNASGMGSKLMLSAWPRMLLTTRTGQNLILKAGSLPERAPGTGMIAATVRGLANSVSPIRQAAPAAYGPLTSVPSSQQQSQNGQ
jgi:hypothetical protein